MGLAYKIRAIGVCWIAFLATPASARNALLQECLKQLQDRAGDGSGQTSNQCTQQPPRPHTPSREMQQIHAKTDPKKVTLTASGFSGSVIWVGSENHVSSEFNKADAQKIAEARENEKIQTRLYQAFADRAEALIRSEMDRFKKVRGAIKDYKKASQGIETQIHSFNTLCEKLKVDPSVPSEMKTALASVALSGMLNSDLFRTLIVSPQFQKRISSDLVDFPSAMDRCIQQGKGIRPRKVTTYTGASIYAPTSQMDDATYMSEADLKNIFTDAQDNLKKGIDDIEENRAAIRKLKPLPPTATARDWADRVRTLRIMNGQGAQYYPLAMLAVANEVESDKKYGLREFGTSRVTVEVCQSLQANARSLKDSAELNALILGAGMLTLPLAFAVPGAGIGLFSLMMTAAQTVEGLRQVKMAEKVEIRALAGTLSRMLNTTTARNEISEASTQKAMEWAGLVAGAMGAVFDSAQLLSKLRPGSVASVSGEAVDQLANIDPPRISHPPNEAPPSVPTVAGQVDDRVSISELKDLSKRTSSANGSENTDELMASLGTSNPKSIRLIEGGDNVSKVYLVQLENGNYAIFKPEVLQGPSFTSAKNEQTAFVFSDFFGLKKTNPITKRSLVINGKETHGTLQAFEPNIGTLESLKKTSSLTDAQKIDELEITMFNFAINNVDGGARNILVRADGSLMSIDHSLSLREGDTFLKEFGGGDSFSHDQQRIIGTSVENQMNSLNRAKGRGKILEPLMDKTLVKQYLMSDRGKDFMRKIGSFSRKKFEDHLRSTVSGITNQQIQDTAAIIDKQIDALKDHFRAVCPACIL